MITVLGHELSLPLLLSAAAELKEAEFAELVRLLEVFAFRYKNIGNGHAGKPGNLYYRHAVLVRAGTFDIRSFRVELRELINQTAPDDVFQEALVRTLRYDSSAQRKNIRYFFCYIEEYSPSLTSGTATPRPTKTKVIDIEQLEIEHIYPQKPMAGQEIAGFEELTDAIGNLACWAAADNKSASNESFSSKRQKYQASEMLHLREVAKLSKWEKQKCLARQKNLVAEACKIFTI